MRETLVNRNGFTIGGNIAQIRNNKKMSQYDVAAALQRIGLGYSRSHLANIERDYNNVPIPLLVGLKIVFDCDFSDFFHGLEEKVYSLNQSQP